VNASTLTVDASKINTTNKYNGYKLDSTATGTIPATAKNGDVIRVYYVKDESQTKTLSYTVEYYKDNVKVDADTQIESAEVWVNASTLTVDASKINTTNKYNGYKLDSATTGTIPVSIANGGVIKVYYVKDTFGYTVEYYYDDVKDDGKTENLSATYQSVIDTYPDKVVTDFVLEKVVGLPLTITENTATNVIKVYYATDKIGPEDPEGTDPNKPGDRIPDKYQFTVTYKATNGKVSISSTVVTKLNNAGNPSAEGTAKLADNQVATATANSGYRQSSLTWSPETPFAGLVITANTTFTAKFSSIPVYDDDDDDDDDGKDIKDPEVPLGGLQLNKDDHFAYIKGYADGTVRPDNFITRAQVATIFYRLMTDETRMLCFSETNDFSDVPADYWANKAISTLSNAGIITGFSDGTFRPNAFITRAQFAAIAARFSVVTEDLPNPFSDVPEGYWAEDLIAYAAHLGWVNGYPDGTFRPTANITRAAAMKLINNVLERQVDEDGLLEDATSWNDCTPDDWCYYIVMEATNSHDWERRSKKSLVEDWTALTADRVWDE
ncbi:S-layer homology domain-containing protein, partial [Oscillibacter valericigenes]|uniref:S-layer homology domain-containing protein n=1 Tax=Oscillibacter valericigenes TaxID=351091 RepID=UPI001F1D43FE